MTSRESNDDTAFDSCFCLQIYKLFSIRLHFQYKKLESSLKMMAADPFSDRLPESREWVSNHIFKDIHRNSKETLLGDNQHFVNFGYSHKFLKKPLFCCFLATLWLPESEFFITFVNIRTKE